MAIYKEFSSQDPSVQVPNDQPVEVGTYIKCDPPWILKSGEKGSAEVIVLSPNSLFVVGRHDDGDHVEAEVHTNGINEVHFLTRTTRDNNGSGLTERLKWRPDSQA